MKKLAIATMVALFALPATASNWYVQGDLGKSNLRADIGINNVDVLNDKVKTLRLSVGYRSGNLRIAGDYTKFGNASFNLPPSVRTNVSLKTRSLGISTIYDFNNSSNLTPYVGARLSQNKYTAVATGRYNESESASSMGVGLLGGVQYRLGQHLSLNTNLEYNRIAQDVGQFGLHAGLRFDF